MNFPCYFWLIVWIGVITSLAQGIDIHHEARNSFDPVWTTKQQAPSRLRCGVCDGPNHAPLPGMAPQRGMLPLMVTTANETDTVVTVDAMIVFTQAASDLAGGDEALKQAIWKQVNTANEIFQNSNTMAQVNVVAIQEIDYQESGKLGSDLGAIGNSNGTLYHQVRDLREAYKADLFVLVVEVGDGGGIANILDSINQASQWENGLSVLSALNMFVDHSLLAHEWGHNFGCHHEAQNAGSNQLTPYAFGYDFLANGIHYGTVMSYNHNTIPLFSNPNLMFEDQIIGIKESADNARLIRVTADTVNGFFNANSRFTFAERQISIHENIETLEVNMIRSGDTTKPGFVELEFENIQAQLNTDYEFQTETVQFEVGETAKRLSLIILDDDIREGNETFRIHLKNPSPLDAIGTIPELTITIEDNEPGFEFTQTSYIASESNEFLTAELIGFASEALLNSLELQTTSEDATPGEDFADQSFPEVLATDGFHHTLRWPLILNDYKPEVDETLSIQLNHPESPDVSAEAIVIIRDDDRIGYLDDQTFPPIALTQQRILSVLDLGHDRILVAGNFDQINGQSHYGMGVLNRSGQINTQFPIVEFSLASQAPNGIDPTFVEATASLDGRIYVYRQFEYINGQRAPSIARLNGDGSLDETFHSAPVFDHDVLDVLPLKDGKLLVAGRFLTVDGRPAPSIARLQENGSVDPSFVPDSRLQGDLIWTMKEDHEGRILLGGRFSVRGGLRHKNITRIHPDGSLDESFDQLTGADDRVYSIEETSDGKILLGGLFQKFNGGSVRHLIRLNPDGSRDLSFNTRTRLDGNVRRIVELPNGQVMIGGSFTKYDGEIQVGLALLLPNGKLDPNWNSPLSPGDSIRTFELFPSGDIYITGIFDVHKNGSKSNLLRLRHPQVTPNIVQIEKHPDGTQIRINSLAWGKLGIESSSDLVEWKSHDESIPAKKNLLIKDPNPEGGHRFYRVIQNP